MNDSLIKLRRQGFTLLLATGLGAAAAGVMAAPSYETGRPSGEAVSIGMTQQQVQQALGGYGHETNFRGSPGPVWTFTTHEGNGPKLVTVTFDAAGKVSSVFEQELSTDRAE